MSVTTSFIPDVWKVAIIHPIPKINPPADCADFRPISITPILSRILERLIVKTFIYPIFEIPQYQNQFSDQFAFRPTGSTTAALISLFHHITSILAVHTHVHVIALDFSKAFDSVRHSSLASKLASLPLPDCIYNWLLNFLSHRRHCTKFAGLISKLAEINASFVQGSVTAPTKFVIDASDLKAITTDNLIPKYADDAYLIVPLHNARTIELELQGISSWASQNNLTLNYTKSHHIVFRRPRFPRDHDTVARVDAIHRVYEINILGVTITDTLFLSTHVSNLSAKCAQLSFALKTLRSHGLSGTALWWEVTRAHTINRLT